MVELIELIESPFGWLYHIVLNGLAYIVNVNEGLDIIRLSNLFIWKSNLFHELVNHFLGLSRGKCFCNTELNLNNLITINYKDLCIPFDWYFAGAISQEAQLHPA